MAKSIVAILAVVWLTVPAYAQTENIVIFDRPDTVYTASRVFLYSGLAFDLAATEYALKDGGREWNPVLGQNRYQRVGIATGTIVGVDLISRYLHRNSHPKLAKFVNFFAGGIRFGAGSYNLSQRH